MSGRLAGVEGVLDENGETFVAALTSLDVLCASAMDSRPAVFLHDDATNFMDLSDRMAAER